MSDPHQDDDGLRLLGLYITEFSQLVGEMRVRMVARLQQPANPPMLAWVVFAGAGPREIKSAFFAIARLLTEHDNDESRIAQRLETAVEREITKRNALAHGDLLIDRATPYASITRIQARDPPGFDISYPDLKARCEAIAKLRRMLWQYGMVCIAPMSPEMPQRVSEIMRLDGNDIVPGPKAGWSRP